MRRGPDSFGGVAVGKRRGVRSPPKVVDVPAVKAPLECCLVRSLCRFGHRCGGRYWSPVWTSVSFDVVDDVMLADPHLEVELDGVLVNGVVAAGEAAGL